ncbi:MAG: HAMP domain-containing protein [Desulfitobacterium sp.]|nr:HAMP domain-containing protein [Desulfitobacterium sp.]
MHEKASPWWKRIKFRVLIFGIIMSALPLTVLGMASFKAAQSYLQESIQEQNYERANLIATQIQDFIQNHVESLLQITSTNALDLVGKDPLARETVLATMLRETQYFESLYVANTQYNLLDKISRREVDLPWMENEKLPYLGFAAGNKFSISEIFFTEDGRPQVYLTVNITHPQLRETIGYLQAKTDLKAMFTQFTNIPIGDKGYVYLTDEKGRLISHTDFSKVLIQEDLGENLCVRDFLAGRRPLFTGNEYMNNDGISVIGMFASVGNPPWGVFIEQPVQEAYKPITQFTTQVLGVMLAIIAGMILISIYFGLKVTQPIENFERGVRRIISTEDLEAEIPQESDDEIGRLVQAFNLLLRQLADKTANLKAEHELLDTVVQGIGAGMVLLNQEKEPIWFNSIFTNWFGEEEELQNSLLQEVFRDRSKEGTATFDDKSKVFPFEVQGEKRYFRYTHYQLSAGKPEEGAFLLLLEDVTQQVEMEARVIETEKMATVGLLASGVAHEINNPLAILSAHNEDLLDRLQEEELPSPEEVQSILKIIAKQIERCKKVTSRLLHFARPDQEGLKFMEVQPAILQTADFLRHSMKQKRISLKMDMEENLRTMGNENEWQQVILNIMTNAIDASPMDSELVIRVKKVNDSISVEVEDQGQGIPQQYLHKVMDPFFTTKPSGQGTGLGLFVTYGIIQKMGGKLHIDSREGEGTIIKILLPYRERGMKL